MSVLLQSEVVPLPFDVHKFEETAQNLLKSTHLQSSELSILLVHDEKIAHLNEEYRGKKKATNVLSFPMVDGDETFPGPLMLGDIVISIDTAVREAESHNIILSDYLTILLVHGLVHLLGFDHEQGAQETQQMRDKEKELLQNLHGLNKLTPLSGK